MGCTSWHLASPAKAVVHSASPPPAESAKVCVVRTSVLAQAVTFPTHDNGVLVGATRGPTHFCYLAAPGHHNLSIEADEIEHASFEAEAGKSYFLHQEVDNIFGYVKCRAVWVDEATAKDLFPQSTFEVLTGVPGNEKLPPDPPFAPASAPPPR